MPTPRTSLSCIPVKNVLSGGTEIIAMGGHSAGTFHDNVEIFSMATKSWRKAGRVLVN
jgi:hypothetical protein